MTDKISRCTKCILHSNFQEISFDENGVCSYCRKNQSFEPLHESRLETLFSRVKRKGRAYDALIPLSGGKDSTYVLYLAKKKYQLNVLAYTYDNGFLSEMATQNIHTTVKKLCVDHVFFRPSWELLKRLYRSVLLTSGELCTICGIGIINTSLKLSEAWHIPLILLGTTVTETNSILHEKIYDLHRFKTILSQVQNISKPELDNFLIYPSLHPYIQTLYTYLGRFGQIVYPLYYQPEQNEEEIRKVLSQELDWRDGGKHADCIAEPFSNFIREHRYGYSRRVVYYSNLIRIGEMKREKALNLLEAENPAARNEKTELILNKLDISDVELERILDIETLKYQKYIYKRNHIVDIFIRGVRKVIGY